MRRASVSPLALCLVGLLCSCAAGGAAAQQLPMHGQLLWSADHETGNLDQWTDRQGQAVFNSVSGEVEVVTVDFARSGSHALALRITNDDGRDHGARIFRWIESPEEGFYSAYLYFTEPFPDVGWWNVMQFKSVDAGGRSAPTWSVNVASDNENRLRLYLWDSIDVVSHPPSEARSLTVVPLGRWVHVELYLRRSTEPTGRIALRQDGVLLFDLDGEVTALSDEVHWSLDNYSATPTGGTVTVLADDAEIHAASEAADD